MTEEIPKVKPFKMQGRSLYIVCPYCAKTHLHGCPGHKVAHCANLDRHNPGYEVLPLEEEQNENIQ